MTLNVSAEEKTIGYPSVKQAIEGLIDTPGAEMTIRNEWTVITQKIEDKPVIWSFTPQNHYAYPAVAKREILKDDDGWYVETSFLCEAETIACDELFKEFRALDKRMTESMATGG